MPYCDDYYYLFIISEAVEGLTSEASAVCREIRSTAISVQCPNAATDSASTAATPSSEYVGRVRMECSS